MLGLSLPSLLVFNFFCFEIDMDVDLGMGLG